MLTPRPLGRHSGVVAPRLGFGVSGPHATPLTPPDLTARLIRQALTAGASLFDTAPFYGNGEAERRLGDALDGAPRDQFTLITKAGTAFDRFARARKDFSPAALTSSLEDSLLRLGVDAVDVFLLHGPSDDDLARTDVQGALADLQARGLCHAVGLATRSARQLQHAAAHPQTWPIVMAPVHAALDAEQIAGLQACRSAGVGVIGIEALSPARSGLRWPRSGADLWYLARTLKNRSGWSAQQAPLSARACLQYVFGSDLCDAVVTTSTRPENLRLSIGVAQGFEPAAHAASTDPAPANCTPPDD